MIGYDLSKLQYRFGEYKANIVEFRPTPSGRAATGHRPPIGHDLDRYRRTASSAESGRTRTVKNAALERRWVLRQRHGAHQPDEQDGVSVFYGAFEKVTAVAEASVSMLPDREWRPFGG